MNENILIQIMIKLFKFFLDHGLILSQKDRIFVNIIVALMVPFYSSIMSTNLEGGGGGGPLLMLWGSKYTENMLI